MKRFFLPLTQTHYTFEGKKDYENVHTLLYRHWFVLFEHCLAFIFFAILPVIVYGSVGIYLESLRLASVLAFLTSLYYLVWWYGLAYVVTMYLLDTWIVTDHRVVDSEQHGFFRRTVSELTLSKIQDISVRVRGPITTFFDFGDLVIQTAGTQERFHFKQIPHPRAVKDMIMHAHDRYSAEHIDNREVHEKTDV